jgi:hypothetical protein
MPSGWMKMKHEAEWELNPPTRQTTASPIQRTIAHSRPHGRTKPAYGMGMRDRERGGQGLGSYFGEVFF